MEAINEAINDGARYEQYIPYYMYCYRRLLVKYYVMFYLSKSGLQIILCYSIYF